MKALSVSKQALLGWQMALSFWRVTQFCPSHLQFSPLSWPCSLHCQLPSQIQMLPLHWKSAEGGKNRENRRRKKKFGRGQRDKIKGVHKMMDKTIKENRMKVIGNGIKKDSLPALTVSCYLAPRSPCPQRCTRELRSSLQSRTQKQQVKLFQSLFF